MSFKVTCLPAASAFGNCVPFSCASGRGTHNKSWLGFVAVFACNKCICLSHSNFYCKRKIFHGPCEKKYWRKSAGLKLLYLLFSPLCVKFFVKFINCPAAGWKAPVAKGSSILGHFLNFSYAFQWLRIYACPLLCYFNNGFHLQASHKYLSAKLI